MPYEPFTDVSGATATAPAASEPKAESKPVTASDLETFRKSLKEELLNSLKFDMAIRGGGVSSGGATPATEQGVEYIRKDSIPCWGCKL